MKRIEEPLAKHTTFNIGGKAEIVLPESEEELIHILRKCKKTNRKYRILGNGSNILISDDGLDELIIKITECCKEISVNGNKVRVGASVKLQKLINILVDNELGGIEYLYSVPGTVGGAIYMNAGRGKKYNLAISDHLKSVKIYDGGKIVQIQKNKLNFDYRHSIFHEKKGWIILSAEFEFTPQKKEIGQKKIQERMNHVKKNLRSKPNAGSIFRRSPKISLRGLRIGDAKYVSKNRICNMGDASFSDVYRLIKINKLIHQLIPFVKNPELEIQIWK